MHLAGFDSLTEVGRGGFGVVFRAFQRTLHRDVAIKVLTTGMLDGGARQQFEREARALGALGDHPNIIAVHDAGFTPDGAPYLVMPFLEGGSVADRVRASGPIEVAEVLRIGVRLCGALEIAHRRGVVHGDVKPDNVLFDAYEEPQLCDFGIAELLAAAPDGRARSSLTPTFAPPEVLGGDQPTPAADVYGLAITLSTMLRGRVPPGAMQRPHGTSPNDDLARLGVPPVVREVLDRSMRTHPADRIASAEAFGNALIDVQRQLGLPETRMRVIEVAAADRPSGGGPPLAELPRWPGREDAPDDPPVDTEDLLGAPTMVRGGTRRPAGPLYADTPEHDDDSSTRSRRTTLIVRIAFGFAVLASVAVLVLGRTGEDPLAGTSPIFGRLSDPGTLAGDLGAPDTFDGRARLMGAWWSLTDFCVDDGYGLAPCYDAAADVVIGLVGVDPRGIALRPDLDRASVIEGLEQGYALSQVQLDRSPSRMPLDELTPGRPGIDLLCPRTCTAIVADVEAARPTSADVLSDEAPPAPDGVPQPTEQ